MSETTATTSAPRRSDATRPIEFTGINHLALVSSDMAKTVDFYSGVLGMPLTKTIEIPGGGQHFFFDCGNGDSLAFFWFPNAPQSVPGVSQPANRPDQGDIVSAHGSMNHVAFNVSADQIDDCLAALRDADVDCTEVWNHDDSEWGVSREQHDGVFVRSIYFSDPDGVSLEIAAWTRELGPDDVSHEPRTAADA
ncbi:VOC family protein [Ilumatobacter nonamiensis]|uniref:VOC family protein n=1 Tax=Ilumatobacter nonamiensis TaxID=467093 RepID=UPI000A062805|nr:VOC family protein [Ilumatobacter nonamiensis]